MSRTANMERVHRKVETANRSAIARELELDRSHVSHVLGGKYLPSLPVAAGMAKKIGVTLDDFYACLAAKMGTAAVN